jgi:4-hydroxyphenylpyruvate dioxygenase
MTTMTNERASATPTIEALDHVEYYVGNAKMAAFFYVNGLGFDLVAYAGPETGVRDRVSYVVEQGTIRFVLTGALDSASPIAAYHRSHGDGIRAMAFRVADAEATAAFARTQGAGAATTPSGAPAVLTYGDTVHSFLDADLLAGPYAKYFRREDQRGGGLGLDAIDHIVGNVLRGELDAAVDFYHRALGFRVDEEFVNDTGSTTIRWRVLRTPNGRVTLPINEPGKTARSPIDEYLVSFGGPGVHHIALHSSDIVATVGAMRERGVKFVTIAPERYDEIVAPIPGVREPFAKLREHSILVDEDAPGYLLQIFTAPLHDRPTTFFEIIQRADGARGFGGKNVGALIESVERDQAARAGR